MKTDPTADNRRDTPTQLASNKGILTRYAIVVVLLGFVVVGILAAVFKVAFSEREAWLAVARKIEQPNRRMNAVRGNIYAGGGELMATNVPYYRLYIDFKADGFVADTFLHSKRNGVDSLSYWLSRRLKDRTQAGYRKYLLSGMRSKSREFPVSQVRVSYSDLKAIRTFPFFRKGRNVSGLFPREIVRRQKIYGSLASRTIGDIRDEFYDGYSRGRHGMELQYDSLLRGETGLRTIVNVGGRWTNVVVQEPGVGCNIHTTLDIQIQDFTERALLSKLKEIDAESGTAVVMEVKSGEIKAISNLSRLRPGVYGETKNHAVADEIEPGSTFKVAALMAALDDGLCSASDIVETGNGVYTYARQQGREYNIVDHNANHGGYGTISVAEAMWYSSNIGIAKTILRAYGKQPKKFVETLDRMGVTEDLRLDIPGAGRAKIRRPGDRQWSSLTLPWMSFGYEVQIPPIYTLTFFNAIANDGKMVRPLFVKEISRNGKTVERYKTETVREAICSPQTLQTIRSMLLNVVKEGTGQPVRSEAVTIAGKTGTAQIASGGGYQSHNVSFCGYFPADRPQYSCIVVIRRPRNGYPSGGTMSGGVFKAIAERVYSRRSKVDIDELSPAPDRVALPLVKNGSTKGLGTVLKALNIASKIDNVNTNYTIATRNLPAGTLEVRTMAVPEGTVPRVLGMGARDAVHLLERAGMRVSPVGQGTVVSQSAPPGSRVAKGTPVVIILKN